MPLVTKEETYIFCNNTCNLQIQWLAERKAFLSIKTVYNYIATWKISQIHTELTVG